MPAAISHTLMAETVLDQWKGPSLVKDAFLLGSQGPDFLFFHRLPMRKGTPLFRYGSALHRTHVCITLQKMRQYMEDHPQKRDIILSYCLGFLCHYSLDRTAHPFILSGVEWWASQPKAMSKPLIHSYLETLLDVILLRREKGIAPIDFPLKQVIPKSPELWNEVGGLYAFLLQELYQVEESPQVLAQAVHDARTCMGFLHDGSSFKRPAFQMLERLLHKGPLVSAHIRPLMEPDDYDYANVERGIWRAPGQEMDREESFFDLFDRSVEEALTMMDAFYSRPAGSCYCDITHCLSFSDGLPSQDIVCPKDFKQKDGADQ